MSLTAFIADSIIDKWVRHSRAALIVENGKIKAIVGVDDVPQTAIKHHLPGLTLAAGLIDLQVNGGGNILLNESPTASSLEKIAKAHLNFGTTSFMPTLISDDLDKAIQSAHAVIEFKKTNPLGQMALGLHLEGPFLNPAKHGIHAADKIQKMNLGFLDDLNLNEIGTLLMTIAPELCAAQDLKKLSDMGVILSAGHSQANKADLTTAKENGLTGITHLFNAMGEMSARTPGLSGLALDDNDLMCSIIADGHHVDALMLRLALKAKTKERLFFISDAMPPAGTKDKRDFFLQGKNIKTMNGACRDENGNLAGSASTVFDCVVWAVKEANIPLETALYMANSTPARFIKMHKNIGSLSPTLDANFIAFDYELNLHKVFIAGQAV
jgi:N-acetylglucosamine-6-phosphate deacetylase